MQDSHTIALSSPWGTGKSIAIEQWQKHIKSKEVGGNCFIFNAWETDFTKHPMLAFVGEFIEELEKQDFVKSELKKLGKEAARIAIYTSLGTLNKITDVDKIKEAIENNLFKAYKEEKDAKAEFNKILKESIQTIFSKTQKPFVVFVDELDRCRPDYAIEVLECIKHFFNIPNLIFILAVDKTQIKRDVQKVYGGEVNAQDYLNKFIDISLTLPAIEFTDHAKYLNKKFDLTNNLGEVNFISFIMRAFDLSMREQRQFFTLLNYVYKKQRFDSKYNQVIMALFATKIKYEELYLSLITQKIHKESGSETSSALGALEGKIKNNLGTFFNKYKRVFGETMFLLKIVIDDKNRNDEDIKSIINQHSKAYDNVFSGQNYDSFPLGELEFILDHIDFS